ncbi:hypothetical protein N431DRAFT_368623 [Stipitochalara longipes BDJ]|nr:hypothetical protein N431DRAFT_368623 [Stipitochalara longipes BDJ]
MATSLDSSTPPPPSSIYTPSTPRLGALDDDYQPYSPRKSARVSQRSTSSARTHHNLRKTPGSSKNVVSTSTITSPSSPKTASKKRAPKNSPMVGGRRVSGALDYDSAASAAAALGLPAPKNEGKMEVQRSTAAVRKNGMLPTPAKTPKKRPDEYAPAINTIARNLFPIRSGSDEEVMPSPKKRNKKYTGLTLDSFEAEDDAPIHIYTDSHDRVPEVDLSPDNPFYGEGNATVPEPTKRASKRRKITVPGEGAQSLEELQKREDGLIYTFRGKNVFRKFADIEDLDEDTGDVDDDLELDETLPSSLRGPLTRSSVKPRLLFRSKDQEEMRSHNTEDEEADTDIDDRMDTSTPIHQMDDAVTTPKAPRFAPASPPSTVRGTRSKNVDLSSSPGVPTSEDEHLTTPQKHNARRSGGVSPFNEWKRRRPVTKNIKKREGEPLARGGADKKLRG